jgi:hypothetical protein
MKSRRCNVFFFIVVSFLVSCQEKENTPEMNILFLHHSTGNIIWQGTSTTSFITKVARRINPKLVDIVGSKPQMQLLFEEYNHNIGRNYLIKEMTFPNAEPYGWHNYPYDYYNIWVKNAGEKPFMEEPTLEMLTNDYKVIIFKHCFPVCSIEADQGEGNIDSDQKTILNYKLQYKALRDKLHEFPDTKFILLTGAARVKASISEDEAKRAGEFFKWVVDEWDMPDDNIYIWDLYYLQTEGGLYFRDEFALSPDNSHPSKGFASRVVKLLFNRIIDIIENDGRETKLTGEYK